ncbi:SET and MYND domain protein [Aspergillus sclerotioniger CBS 115572]|uniref:SET and MYND domain protein n=1 Tax=Aspergillus sclerotioniger CBS 115572 TaxID=1450535 RepID=A0A317VJR9_9EURO|nr:SET and MYND domain protein [Aspergillus sclerotioniger CBS 115572]PWY74583.1 SET and MYND domain protein [Aspergillus sclerotioniger CBS 115572]
MSAKTTSRPAPGGLGRGLFASTDIAVGENVLDIPIPFVAVLDTQRLEDTCSGCFGQRQLENEEITLKACTGCQVVKYCDKTCQAKDWKFSHALECSIFQQLKPRVLPINARAVLRMVLRSGRRKYSDEELDQFLQLETHIKDIRDHNAPQWERISLSSKAVKTYSGTDMSEEVISAFGAKLELNSFNLTNALYDRIGVYLHPYAAIINHSCNYNSVVNFDGPNLQIKALHPIPKDSQIFISYIDTTNLYSRRQSDLQDRYYFTCHCSKCSKEATTAATTTLLTPIQQKAYTLLSSIPDLPATEATQSLLSTITLLQTSGEKSTTQPSISLRDELIATLISGGKFKSAFAHAALRYLRVDPVVYPSQAHPIRQVHAWALAKLAIHLSQGVKQMVVIDEGVEEIALEQYEVNFSLIIWSVLGMLVGAEDKAGTGPGFKRLVRRAFEEVNGEFLAGGLDPRRMGEGIKGEWGKVDRLVDGVLNGK